MDITTGYAPVEGGELYYEVAGQGYPLVLIHAGVADCRMWDEQFEVFADRYRVVRYDTRGFGKTRTQAVSFSNRQDVADLLDHLGLQRAYVLGLSRGGIIALDFTLEFPHRAAALISVASGIGGFETPPTETELDQFSQMEALWEAKDFEALTDLEVRVWGDGPGQPEGRAPAPVREKMRDMILNNYRTQTVEPQARPLDPPAVGRLGEVRVPTLVMVGDLDTSSCQAAMDHLARTVADAQKVVFPGVAHMVNLERPTEFNQTVLNFLDGLG